MVIKLSMLAAQASEKMSSELVGTVVFTGLVVVFVALILLVLCVSLFGKIFDYINKPKDKKQKLDSEPKKAIVNNDAPVAPAVEDGINDEVVAVITAAVAALNSNAKGVTYSLKSIKKADNFSRRAWANAGIMENSRPF